MTTAVERWTTFLAKVRARLHEILEEAHAGMDDIIATEVLDPGPISAAENEVKARLFNLREKISPAWAKLEAELGDELAHLEAQGRQLESDILRAIEALERRTRAKVIERLEALAAEERATRTLKCAMCGGPLPEPAVQHRVENVTCTHCDAVNTVRPGLATAMLHALRPRR